MEVNVRRNEPNRPAPTKGFSSIEPICLTSYRMLARFCCISIMHINCLSKCKTTVPLPSLLSPLLCGRPAQLRIAHFYGKNLATGFFVLLNDANYSVVILWGTLFFLLHPVDGLVLVELYYPGHVCQLIFFSVWVLEAVKPHRGNNAKRRHEEWRRFSMNPATIPRSGVRRALCICFLRFYVKWIRMECRDFYPLL